ncbi:ATP-dependent helicase [Pseudonocardia sp. DSM 110487]|uniref:DEAD/DEAH box helicase n=1 Tax=Pseudonocardia sp. DSM 110487 TaxID=2865833 RepID=UPI001C6A0786|nr:DEAD/DEAH box helicase [Pseudonocardia sp. DSM 110487]QYN31704.1 ATP-dependent helicase [Pseudonocardia sp. DSM 110487]
MSPAAEGRAPSRTDLAVFVPADPPRAGQLLLTGDVLTGLGTPGAADVVPPPGDDVRNVPVRRIPVAEALAPLLASPTFGHGESGDLDAALRFWADAARFAVHLVARGRLLPGVSPAGFDAWRVGPLDADDADRLHSLAAAMPPSARAVPAPGEEPVALPAAAPLLRAFLDAVADVLPRSPEAVEATGTPVYASPEPHAVPHLRDWADEVAAGFDAGVRLSLRVEVGPDATRFRAVVQLHALDDPTRVADLAAVWSGAAVGFGPRGRIDALLAVRRAARFWDPLQQLLGQAVPDVLDLDDGDVTDLLGDGSARLAAAGVAVHWPRDLRPELSARVVAGRGSGPTPFTAGGEPLHLDWELALRGDPLTGEEMAELAASHRPVVRLRDEWVLVDPATRARATDRTLGPVSPVSALGAALTGQVDDRGTPVPVLTTGWLQELKERIAAPPAPLAPPDGLAATLRDYQLRGLGWLDRMTSLGLGACLADDMGLGKTITLIALHLHRAAGPTLVVCPASLLGNWEREITRFAPGVPVDRYHGSGRELPEHDGFVLTTYATMRLDVDALAAHRWGLVVADEAQHVKNPASGTAAALRRIPSAARVALTGTPVENDLVELWSILDWTTPGLLGTLAEFRARWADPISEDPGVGGRFARLIAPFLLRRRKSDPGIAPELPRKTETDRPVGLTREQAGLYEAVVAETMERIARADGMARRGLVLALLTALKQICDHPALYAKEPDPVLRGRSGKLELLDELLDTILAEDGAALVFTQYVTMGRLLERHLRARGTSVQFLHGGTPVPEREAMVERFQRGEAAVFLLSLRAAGTGLNLTRADHVVHFDRWWNPAVEEQATDRAYRIGQTRPVQVHRLISEGTVEDRIAALLESKRALADSVLAGGEAALTELTDAQLADLVALRGES